MTKKPPATKSSPAKRAPAKAAKPAKAAAPQTLPPLEPDGPIAWAILAPITAADFERVVLGLRASWLDPDDPAAPRSWGVLKGTKKHTALIETAHDAAADDELANLLSRHLSTTVYLVEFSGYDDPDEGVPSIFQYDRGARGEIYFGMSDEEQAELLAGLDLSTIKQTPKVPGPPGIPNKDPFEFCAALGCDVRPYYDE